MRATLARSPTLDDVSAGDDEIEPDAPRRLN
jgi:hypothetical protein